MFWLYAASGVAGLVLQTLLIEAMLRSRGYRDFPVLFIYVLVLYVTSCLEAAEFLMARGIASADSYYYWVVDAGRQALLYLAVISLTCQAVRGTAQGRLLRRLLVAGTALFVAASLYGTHRAVLGHWMTGFSRNLGFSSVILTAILWAALLKYRRPDPTLLMITGGLGIQMAGKAIGHSLRQISRDTITAGNLTLIVSHLVCIYVWWQVFRRRAAIRGRERP